MSNYTERNVYKPLAAKLPKARPIFLDLSRFSIEMRAGGAAGMAGQRAGHFTRYQSDAGIAQLRAIPEEAWDPKDPALGAQYGIVWITLADLHPSLTSTQPFAAVVSTGDIVFVSVNLSATEAHIVRDDGSEENGYTWLVQQMLCHYRNAEAVRWADDLNRASRTEVGWALIKKRCKSFGIQMVFGGQAFDLGRKGDRTSLGVLTVVSTEDDSERREKLTGKRVAKFDLGGAAVPEHGMPKGWVHAKDQWGRQIREGEKGFLPVADPAMIPVLQKLFERHAAGDSYQALHAVLVDFEVEGNLKRRDHRNPDNTYAAARTEGSRRDAVRPFFTIRGVRPAEAPSEGLIARYLNGEDPADLFEPDVRAYLSRVELVRTGRYYRRLINDMEGIATHGVNGYRPIMLNDDDTKGAFYVLSEPWPWPIDETKQPVPRFGLSEETCRAVGARLLRELLENQEAGGLGGRRRGDGLRRALQTFGNWRTEPDDPANAYEDEPTSWGVRARSHRSGKNTFCVMHRPASQGTGAWGYLPEAASGSIAELSASLARAVERAARTALAHTEVVTLDAVRVAGDDPAAGWTHRIGSAEDKQEVLRKESDGFGRLAARAEVENRERDRDRWLESRRAADDQIAALETEITTLRRRIEEHRSAGTDHAADAQLNVLAYLVAALEAAARNRGLTSERVGKLCDEMFTNWRFVPSGELLEWSCTALVPVTSGHRVQLPLNGSVRNLRTETGHKRRRLQGAAQYVFGEGRNVDEVAAFVECNRRTLHIRYLMPWLRDNGIVATGLKCALIDHPISLVRQVTWRLANNLDTADLPLARAYVDAIQEVYFDPDGIWGNTAVPDDVSWIQRAVDLLAADDACRLEGRTVEEMALLLGKSEWWVRQLVVPRTRKAGFRRPRFLEYADSARTRVRPIHCPHDRQPATHVSLLPEVAISGVGILCTRCRRVPIDEPTWKARLYPKEYLDGRWTVNPARASIMDACQTVTF